MRTSTRAWSWWLVASVLFVLAGCDQAATTIEAGTSASPSARSLEPSGDAGAVAPDCAQFEEPAAVDGPLSEDPEIAAIQRARAEYGLPSDEETVRAVLEQTESDHYLMGFAHTQEEFGELNARSDLGGRHAEAIHRWANREASDAFAGMWLDHQAGGVFTVAFTHDLERFRRTVHERFDPAIKVVAAEHPIGELRALQETVTRWMQDQMQERAGAGPRPGMIWSVYASDPENRVRILVFEPNEAHRREFGQRWGADRICLEPFDIPETEDAQPAGWVPAPDADLSPGSTRIDVLVNELACAGGRSAEGRIVPPTVEYQPDAVIITIEVIPTAGLSSCPGNLDTPYTVELDEPLGDRQLLDGRTEPPSDPSLELNPESDASE